MSAANLHLAPVDPAWRPTRRIGGSDIAKLLGLSPYGNELSVYLRVVEGVEEGWNPAMDRGAAMEPILRAHGQRLLGLELESPESDVHNHPTAEFARAQVDDVARWNGLPVVVDYKTQSAFAKGWGASGGSDVPEHIRAQVAWEMACTDRDLGLLVVGFGVDAPAPHVFEIHNLCHYEIERDPVFEAFCLQTAREFWERHVLTRTPPDVEPFKRKRSSRKKSTEVAGSERKQS